MRSRPGLLLECSTKTTVPGPIASVPALEEIEDTSVGDAIAERVVAALQTAYLVKLAQAGDVDGDVGQNRCQMLDVRC